VSAQTRKIGVRIRRSGRSGRETFMVEAADPVTVLDLLREIQRTHDPSLGFRYSCRVAMCGTCAVRVDGRSALACRTVVAPDADDVEIAPLAGLPVIRDLVVDTRPFWRQWTRIQPWFVPGDGARQRIPVGSDEDRELSRTLGCIACGACYSSCEVAGGRSDYLGPAALNRAFALIADPRDGAADERLAVVGSAGGVDRCHYVGACTSACPIGLDPARSIVELRRLRLQSRG
jgi:succinate dehydrogenase / fumarate reductase iron-sulfur subunit/fumarate reductase iron-sulfur subunit